MRKLTIAVVGGDMRQAKLAELLAEDGHTVRTFALDFFMIDAAVYPAGTLRDAVADADCVVLPLPILGEDGNLNSPLVKDTYSTEETFAAFEPGQIVCAGRISGELFEKAGRLGIRLYDYFAREELAIANAVPTAEGAIQVAMEELPITIMSANCLVIGYGRLGKLLSNRLKALGAKVTVAARKYSDLAWIKAYGYEGANVERLDGTLSGYDIIFNTVPHRILNEKLLSEIDDKCVCIDLASKPGGIDFTAASMLGVKAIWALSLPGKVAPVTAGAIIKDTIYNILHELGV